MGIVLPMAHRMRAQGPHVYQYRGIFHAADSGKYFSYPLIIPRGTRRVEISLAYTHNSGNNVLGVQVFDQNGFRARGRAQKAKGNWGHVESVIDTDCRNRGVVPGEIAPGIWTLEIDTYCVKSGCIFELVTEIYQGATVSPRQQDGASGRRGTGGFQAASRLDTSQRPLRQRSGWYRGDLHVHSEESDGTLEVRDLMHLAIIRGLDFLAITDHNVHTAWQQLATELSEFCLPLTGIELSTYQGHGNALGVRDWVDWRLGLGDYGVNEMIRRVQELGGIFSINHPRTGKLPIGHACWRAEDVDYNLVDAIEVWNAPVFSNGTGANQESRRFWDQLLNQGYRITGIGGSDAHYTDGSHQPLGVPLTYVYALSLSQAEIISGIRKGNVFMTVGPKIYFTATSQSGTKAIVGESLALSQCREQVWLHINIKGAPLGSELRLLKNGTPCLSEKISDTGLLSIAWSDDEALGAAGSQTWYRVELYASTKESAPGDDGLLAITNPIYVDVAPGLIA
ncbi:MAG: CehA/McbA family metallohydrolase [Thermacetogeniaceae bacterium]